jgi:hypothetical protein
MRKVVGQDIVRALGRQHKPEQLLIMRSFPNQSSQQSIMTLFWIILILVALVFLAGNLTNLPGSKGLKRTGLSLGHLINWN